MTDLPDDPKSNPPQRQQPQPALQQPQPSAAPGMLPPVESCETNVTTQNAAGVDAIDAQAPPTEINATIPPQDAFSNQPGQVLASLDFASIIGGPLVAAVNATAQAANATAQYVMQVGFVPGTTELQTVTFNYTAFVNNTTQSNQMTPVSASITVPLLSMLPIPYLRIDSMTIDFKVQLQSMNMVTNTNIFATTNTVTGGTGGFLSLFETAQFSVSVADQNINTAVSQQQSTYSLDVTVHAGVDPMPQGMQTVLNIFNSTIQQQVT